MKKKKKKKKKKIAVKSCIKISSEYLSLHIYMFNYLSINTYLLNYLLNLFKFLIFFL